MDEKRKPFGVEVRILNNLIKRYFEMTPSHSEMERLTGSNGWIIRFIDRNSEKNIFQRDLEAEFGITRSTASRVVNLMVQKGLIEHQSVAGDARLKKLVLTDKARELSMDMRQHGDRVENALLLGMNEQEINNMYSVIQRMQKNVEKLSTISEEEVEAK